MKINDTEIEFNSGTVMVGSLALLVILGSLNIMIYASVFGGVMFFLFCTFVASLLRFLWEN